MASKQFGKLRQWGREVISSKEKTVLTDEFKALEQDVALRKAGIERLHEASIEYHGYLHKKKEYTSVEEGVKMLPVDALGAVMMSHGAEFGDDSAFGQCLVKFGRAHCRIATLQETYSLTLRDTFLSNLEAALDQLSDYTAQRKKLDSRRLAYDAAVVKASKAKKEKDISEAEEEVNKAKLRYEETSNDVQARIRAIQEHEIQQLRELTEFLNTEMRFVQQYLDVLRDTQDEWLDEAAIVPPNDQTPRRTTAPHAFAFGRSTPSISSTSRTSIGARPPSSEDVINTDRVSGTPRPSSRASAASGGTAHTSRRRGDSVGSNETGKRSGVTGWASSAVSSLGRSKKDPKKDKTPAKERDKDKEAGRAFASLENADDESGDDDTGRDADWNGDAEHGLSRSLGPSSLSKALSRTPPMSLRAPLDSSSSSSSFNSYSGSEIRKTVRAVHDFSGSSDELSFRAGDEISVIASDIPGSGGWSRGELNGRRGLFPTSYVEDVPLSQTRMTSIAQRAQNDALSEDDVSVTSMDLHGLRVYDEPFGDHNLAKSPMMAEHDHDDTATEDEDGEMRGLFATSTDPAPKETYTSNGVLIGNAAGDGVPRPGVSRVPPALPQRKSSSRKPPPPPPRRSTISNTGANPPSAYGPSASVPSLASGTDFPAPPTAPRRSTSRARSANSLPQFVTTPPTASVSPFDN